jgi:hypothetical protein
MPSFSMLENFALRREVSDSLDEILIGQLIAVMVEKGYPMVGISSDPDHHSLRFRMQGDEVLYYLCATLHRTPNKLARLATLSLTGQVKNFLTRSSDLVDFYAKDHRRLSEHPLQGGVTLSHQLNSVLGTVQRQVRLDKATEPENLREMEQMIEGVLMELRQVLLPFKR